MSNNTFITPAMLADMSSIQSNIVKCLLYKESNNAFNQDNISINSLPHDVHDKIVEHYKTLLPSKYVLRDWVPREKLDWYTLSGNPCASELLMEQADYENTLTEEEYNMLIKEKKISWMRVCCINGEAIDILKKYPSKIQWAYLSNNKKQQAVDMIKERIEYEKINVPEYYEENRVCINNFSDNENPQIIEFIKERIEYEKGLSEEEYKKIDIYDVLDWSYISANPNAIDILKDNIDKINWFELSSNTNPRAIELLRERAIIEKNMSRIDYRRLRNKIDWFNLSINPNAIDLLKENEDNIMWGYLSGNPNAIDLLEKNKDEIEWSILSINTNPRAIEMLNENQKNIDWFMLSKNPNAIELLKKNRENINWRALCINENAHELIKERVEYEMSLNPEEYKELKYGNKLDWNQLSKNKGLFVAV